jgi:hypothetical protein
MRWGVFLLLGCGGASVPPQHGDTVTLTMKPFTVGAGQERYVCQDFANPFGGEAAIARFASHLSAGAHHLLVFYKAGARDSAPADCSGSEFAAGPYGSQRPDDELVYPDGVAARAAAGDGFRLQAHFLNATAAPLEAHVSVEMTRGSLGTQPAAVLFFDNLDIAVPPGGATVSKTCTLPWDVNLLQASGHMHRHGTRFFARTPSVTLYDVAATDAPPSGFDPPLPLLAGTAITFSCTYDNSGATPLTYGESALTNEMCIFSAQFYPAPFGGWSCF